jgi:hypothetical protein
VFVSGLVVSSAHFGGIGPEKDVEQATRDADNLLKYFAAHSPQAVNYHRIVVKLSKAATDHRDKLQQNDREFRTVAVPRLFRLIPENDTTMAPATAPGLRQTQSVENWDLSAQPNEYPTTRPQQEDEPLTRQTNNAALPPMTFDLHHSSNRSNISIPAMLELPEEDRFHDMERSAQTFMSDMAYAMETEYDALLCLGNGNDVLDFSWGGSL